MFTIYDTKDEDALKYRGYRVAKNSTLKSMTKDELIEEIRILEQNWAGEIKADWLQSHRFAFETLIMSKFIEELRKHDNLDSDTILKQIIKAYSSKYEEEKLFGNIGLFYLLNASENNIYFTEADNEIEEKIIEKLKVDEQQNFYDYYKETNKNE